MEYDYVWYASYGSNLARHRFLAYIIGGKVEGTDIVESGAVYKGLPLDDKKLILNYELLFVEKAKRWDHLGVAVIGDYSPQFKTYARMYLIRRDQFIDVVKQENGMDVNEFLPINFPKQILHSTNLLPKSRYGRLLYVGDSGNYPIYTFTTPKPVDELLINKPSEQYLRMIGKGLLEKYEFSLKELVDYFQDKKGVFGVYNKTQLERILRE